MMQPTFQKRPVNADQDKLIAPVVCILAQQQHVQSGKTFHPCQKDSARQLYQKTVVTQYQWGCCQDPSTLSGAVDSGSTSVWLQSSWYESVSLSDQQALEED